MFYKGNEDREKRLRFSIRKVSFGAASVAVAALFMFPGNGTVSATEQGVTPTNEETQGSPLKDPDVQNGTYGATPVVGQMGENSATSEATDPKNQEEPSTPTPTDASDSSVASPSASATEGKSAEKNTEVPSTEANSVENKDQTRATVEEESTRPVETTKPAATTESKKPKSRKKRDISATPDADAATDDPSANQTYKAPSADASVEELVKALKNLPDKIENNEKIQNMNEIGASTGIAVGEVKEIHDFGGWTAVDANGEAGKFAIARKTDEGIFPIETINVLGSNVVWTIEQSFDRTNDYMLFLSKVRTKANRDEESVDNTPYKPSGEGGPRGSKVAKGIKGFRGIEKVFKAYSSKDGSKVQVAFKTGYTGDIDGTKARYKVEVFTDKDGFKTPIYSTSFSPQTPAKDSDKTVIAAKDGTTKNSQVNIGTGTKQDAERILSKAGNRPNGTGGSFTSKEIDLPTGVTSYKVRISSDNDLELGMSYQSRFLQYALPVTGLNFNITQDTKQIAKSLLQQAYDRLLDQQNSDENRKTPETIRSYQEKLDKIKELLDSGDLKSRADYLAALEGAIETRDDLKTQAPSAPVPAVVDTADHVGVEIPAPEHADKVVVTFDKADGSGKDTVTVKKNDQGKWSADKTVAGLTVDADTGKVTVGHEAVKAQGTVEAQARSGNSDLSGTGTVGMPAIATTPSAPVPAVVDTADHVGVEIPAPEHADKVVVTFDKADGSGKDTVTVKKNDQGKWSADKTVAGLTVDADTGK
uniref:YSIRK-type signal peptide-containing protein n=3 Tax=unclassified Streptococcus TaxID=2608887 RepID=UPI0015621FE2